MKSIKSESSGATSIANETSRLSKASANILGLVEETTNRSNQLLELVTNFKV